MKTIISFIVLFVSITFANAQLCTRTAALQDGPDYFVDGTAELSYYLNDSLVLSLSSDFATVDGPDLEVYFANTSLPDGNSYILAPLTSSSGAQSYLVPNTIDIDTYDYIIIHCTEYDHFWGNGMFGNIQGNCMPLSIDDIQQDKKLEIAIYPDYANQRLSIQTTENVSIRMYNVLGDLVKQVDQQSQNFEVEMSDLTSGSYIIQAQNNSKSVTKKVFVN